MLQRQPVPAQLLVLSFISKWKRINFEIYRIFIIIVKYYYYSKHFFNLYPMVSFSFASFTLSSSTHGILSGCRTPEASFSQHSETLILISTLTFIVRILPFIVTLLLISSNDEAMSRLSGAWGMAKCVLEFRLLEFFQYNSSEKSSPIPAVSLMLSFCSTHLQQHS